MTGLHTPIAIDVVSDVVCPWCFIGKRRLDKAVAAADVPVAIRWRPYQLDPTIPHGGKSRREYMAAKFGSAERIKEIQARIEAAGVSERIPFAFDRIAVSPNTLDAHRVIRWAGEAGISDVVVEGLFEAYFLQGRDIGNPAVLAEIAAAAGMDSDAVAARLASDEDRSAVQNEVQAAQRMGVTGVPTFILVGRYAVVGAQPSQDIAAMLRSISDHQRRDEPLAEVSH